MKIWSIAVAVVLVALSLVSAPAFAAQSSRDGIGVPSSTTLDACGYFVGTQTPANIRTTTSGGATTVTERGTWVGVSNNYSFIPVNSLGAVSGGYALQKTTFADGSISGTETFTSSAGTIQQVFTIGPNFSSFDVSVVATRALSFLTSDTDGDCYTGAVPRP